MCERATYTHFLNTSRNGDSKPVVLHGVVVTKVQDPALSPVELHTIDLGPINAACPDPSAEPSYPLAD